MKNRLFVNNNTIILFLFIIGSFLFIELNFRYWYRFLEQYINPAKRNVMVVKNEMRLLKQKRNVLQI